MSTDVKLIFYKILLVFLFSFLLYREDLINTSKIYHNCGERKILINKL